MVPKASVIIPCWNVEKWVEDAVNSVLRSTFSDFEVIAVDDIGQLVMQWQNGSGLNLIPGEDSFRKVGETK